MIIFSYLTNFYSLPSLLEPDVSVKLNQIPESYSKQVVEEDIDWGVIILSTYPTPVCIRNT